MLLSLVPVATNAVSFQRLLTRVAFSMLTLYGAFKYRNHHLFTVFLVDPILGNLCEPTSTVLPSTDFRLGLYISKDFSMLIYILM